jgi:hypothetical protein
VREVPYRGSEFFATADVEKEPEQPAAGSAQAKPAATPAAPTPPPEPAAPTSAPAASQPAPTASLQEAR